jgi:nicotinamide riboside kinase
MAEKSALVIPILGAESTGKTALAPRLAARIAEETGLAATWVPEHLRLWCERAGRTPRADEQAGIAAAQRDAIEVAATAHDVVVADTAPLTIAVYSRLLFDDASLIGPACEWHRRCALTLLTAVDLPWVADGHMRDGPHVREPVDTLFRDALAAHGLPWALVAGGGPARLENALDAVAPLLRRRAAPRRGLFTRLAARNAEDRPWSCELCDDPACEHRTLRGG